MYINCASIYKVFFLKKLAGKERETGTIVLPDRMINEF